MEMFWPMTGLAVRPKYIKVLFDKDSFWIVNGNEDDRDLVNKVTFPLHHDFLFGVWYLCEVVLCNKSVYWNWRRVDVSLR